MKELYKNIWTQYLFGSLYFWSFFTLAFNFDENTIFVSAFLSSDQFDSYILVAVNLVSVIFNLQLIWFLPLIP